MNDSAIVTIAIGEPYLSNWKKYFAPSWQTYARKHGFDVIVVHEPLDRSPLAQSRSPAWQKCLVLSQPFAANYQRIVLLDSDVAINTETAPKITEGAPIERVGGVISGAQIPEDLRVLLLRRLRGAGYDYAPGPEDWRRHQEAYYRFYGFTPPAEGIIQTGVMVTSPAHHGELFSQIYAIDYLQKTRCYEQIPLSYEILRRNLFFSLDPRFNSVFYETMLIYYPYLAKRAFPEHDVLAKHATRVQLLNNFFLHFAYDVNFAQYLFDAATGT